MKKMLNFLCAGVLFISIIELQAKELKKTYQPLIQKDAKMLDANQIGMYVSNDGIMCNNPETGNSGLFYPRGTDKSCVFASGLWFAGKVNGELKTASADYYTEYQCGKILSTGKPDDPALEKYRVYKIKPGDSANPSDPNYNIDYAEWPVTDGAPIDETGNPLIIGDQTLWCVMNDGNADLHLISYKTQPLNIEVHLLTWAFDEDTSPLGKTAFFYYKIINKSSYPIEDAYIGMFVDADLGSAIDDNTACDTTLNLSYAYNGRNNDEVYGTSVPAIGLSLLQGPLVPSSGDVAHQFLHEQVENAKTLNMTANMAYYCAHGRFRQPEYNAAGAAQLYGNFQGLDFEGNPIIDPFTRQQTPLMNTGNPVLNNGWLDYLNYSPPRSVCGDIIFVQGSGPFNMAPLDTQRIVFAFIVGHDNSRLTSILDLKHNANFVRDAFRSEFAVKALAKIKTNYLSAQENEVVFRAFVTGESPISTVEAEVFNYRNMLVHSQNLFDDGLHEDIMANDGIWGNKWKTQSINDALYSNLKVVDVFAKEYLFSRVAQNITVTTDSFAITKLTVVDDHINYDGKLNPGENVRFTFTLTNNFSFDMGAVNVFVDSDDPYIQLKRRHFFINDLKSGQSKSQVYDLENDGSYVEMNIAGDVPDSHTIYFDVSFFDELHHVWKNENYISWQVTPFEYVPNQIIPDHISGYSSARFAISLINPEKLKKHSYVITVTEPINKWEKQRLNLIDQTWGDTLLKNHEAPEEFAFNIPITDGFKVIEAYLPKDMANYFFIDIPGGHPFPFSGLAITLGDAPHEDFCEIELEFTNDIDTRGVIGEPLGQKAFRYNWHSLQYEPLGYNTVPFSVWKLFNGQKTNRLNVCFEEFPNWEYPCLDSIWDPGDPVFIMSSDYDSSGQYYYDPSINPKRELLYRFVIRNPQLISDTSVIDIGDKISITREFRATSEDMWMFVPTTVENEKNKLPLSFTLYQNYPNPFNPTTTIKFSIDKQSPVSLKIYNMLGQEITELINKNLQAGVHSVQWDSKNKAGQLVSSGLYFAKLMSNKKSKLIKMLLIR